MACKGCKRREKALKETYENARKARIGHLTLSESRRGFLRAAGVGAVAMLATTGAQAKEFFITADEADVMRAKSLLHILTVREVVTKKVVMADDGTHTHKFATEQEIRASLKELIESPELAEELRAYPEDVPFWASLDPYGELLHGWVTTIDQRGLNGYVIVTSQEGEGERTALITDTEAIIWRVKFSGPAPRARDLKKASDFPGAVPHNLYSEKRDLGEKASWLYQTVAYRMSVPKAPAPSGTSCYSSCQGIFGCGGVCMVPPFQFCCPASSHPCCLEQPGMWFYAGVHAGCSDCTWCIKDCSNGQLFTCSQCPGNPSDCGVASKCASKLGGGKICCKCPCDQNCV